MTKSNSSIAFKFSYYSYSY